MPQQVCAQCEHDILNTFSFQQQCHKSDSILRAITSEPVQTQLIELKPLATTEDTSIRFSNDALDEKTECDQADNFADEVAQFNDSLDEVIDNQLTFNVQGR